jgi:hypothetical protein
MSTLLLVIWLGVEPLVTVIAGPGAVDWAGEVLEGPTDDPTVTAWGVDRCCAAPCEADTGVPGNPGPGSLGSKNPLGNDPRVAGPSETLESVASVCAVVCDAALDDETPSPSC